jgi:lipopolysaccharide heptosyltransferase II
VSEYRNILLIKPGAVGDLLQLTPVIRGLKRKFPRARITLLLGSAAAAAMFANNPYLAEAVVFDRKGEHRGVAGLLGLWRKLRRQRYDLVVNFQRSNLKAWLLVTAAFPCRVLVYRKARDRRVHAVVNHLETLAPLGIAADDLALELVPGPEDEAYADGVFSAAGFDGRTVVALNPGASHRVNRWDPQQFARLADLLRDEFDARTVIIGGPGDEALADEITATAASQPLVLTGRTTLPQLGAVLKRCAVLVSGDTGPMHLATAVGTKVVALFGAADPGRTGPVGSGHRVVQASGVPCIPCCSRTCNNDTYLECMEKLTAEKVLQVVGEVLQGKELRSGLC